MKTVLTMKHLLYTLFLCLFCCASPSVFAQNDNEGDGDGNAPPSYPPKLPTAASMASVTQTSSSLQVIFLEETDNVAVEISRTDGTVVFVATGNMNENSYLIVDTRQWKQGNYTMRLSVKGKPTATAAVWVEK